MQNLYAHKKTLVISVLVILLAGLILVSQIILSRKPDPSQSPTPSPSSAPVDPATPTTEAFPSPVTTPPDSDEPHGAIYFEPTEYQQRVNVADLFEVIPFDGTPYEATYFTMRYDVQLNKFIVTLQQANRAAAEQEFDTFLKGRGIESRSWVENLMIQYQ